MRSVLAIGLVAACGGSKTEPSVGSAPAPVAPAPTGPRACERVAFAESSPVPEASGAAWLTIDGARALVVISDSGNDGAYAVLDPDTGATREQGRLPLGGPDDDLEGAAVRDGRLVAVTSGGWIREWKRVDHGFELADGPYPLGPVDLPGTSGGIGATPPVGDGMVCPPHGNNCGRDYEGLCLAADGTGYVASKADGHLYAVAAAAGRLVVDRTRAIEVARPGLIADCTFSDDGALYVGSNAFDAGRVYRVDPATGHVDVIADLPIGFPETLAVRGEMFYRMSDMGGSPSLLAKYRCRAP